MLDPDGDRTHSSHGEIRRTGGPTGQKLIRSDKSRLLSGPKD